MLLATDSYRQKTKGAFEAARGAIQTYSHRAPSKAPLILCVAVTMAPHEAIPHLPFKLAADVTILTRRPTNVSPTWAGLTTEQWLLQFYMCDFLPLCTMRQ